METLNSLRIGLIVDMAIRATPSEYFQDAAPVRIAYAEQPVIAQPIYYSPQGNETGKLIVLGIVATIAFLAFLAFLVSQKK